MRSRCRSETAFFDGIVNELFSDCRDLLLNAVDPTIESISLFEKNFLGGKNLSPISMRRSPSGNLLSLTEGSSGSAAVYYDDTVLVY